MPISVKQSDMATKAEKEYMNRVADGLGVGIEAERRPLAVVLFGEQRTEEHLSWSKG